MNRKNLTAAVLAGLAGAAGIVGSAQAVNINPDGLGQVLIYPYYTTNGGNNTLLSVVNTSDDGKAVKVRFMEGKNSQEVLDFNLYMSPYDVWTAVIADVAGTPTLMINDSSCTVPYLYGSGGSQAFLPFEMEKDMGGSDISRASEGHFEMIEMGTLVGSSADAALHGADGKPADCDQLVDAWTIGANQANDGYWLTNPFQDLENPSGGLFGGAAIVNPGDGAMYSYDATALNGYSVSVEGDGTGLHQQPGSSLPSLNSGDVLEGTVFLDNGDTYSASFTRGVDAISFVFMHDQVMNEYTTEVSVAAGTEWVVTFPTKNFYVFADDTGQDDPPVAPFTSVWGDNERLGGYGACEVVILDTIWDREEQSPGDTPGDDIPPIVSPAPPDPGRPGIIPFELCYETSVIRFGGPFASIDGKTPILGSSNFHTIDNTLLGYENGWVRLELDDYPHDANGDGIIDDGEAALTRTPLGGLEGLPVAGFAAQNFKRSFTDGNITVRANYGGLYQHKSTRKLGSS